MAPTKKQSATAWLCESCDEYNWPKKPHCYICDRKRPANPWLFAHKNKKDGKPNSPAGGTQGKVDPGGQKKIDELERRLAGKDKVIDKLRT